MRPEKSFLNVNLTNPETEAKMHQFYDGLQSCIINPPGGDRYYSDYARGLLDGCLDPSTGIKLMLETALQQSDFPTSLQVRKPMDFYQYRLRDNPKYPYDHMSSDVWKRGFADIASDPKTYDEFVDDFIHHVLDTNISSRQVCVPLTAALYPDRFNAHTTFVDYGGSKGVGAKQLAGRWGFPNLPKIILNQRYESHRDIIEAQLNVAASHLPSMPFSKIVTVDKQPTPTTASIERTKTSPHTPSEWAVPENREHFDALIAANPAGVEYLWETDIVESSYLYNSPPNGFDIGKASNVFYPYKGERLQTIFANALANVADDGLFIFQEFAETVDVPPVGRQSPDDSFLQPPSGHGAQLRDIWYPPDVPYPYRTMVYDKREPEAGFRTLFSWPDGRCRDKSMVLSEFAAAKLLEVS